MIRNLLWAGPKNGPLVRRFLLAAAAALLVSCQLIPEIEGDYPVAQTPELSGRERDLFDNRRDRQDETGEGDSQHTSETGTGDEQVSIDTPAEEPVQQAGEPGEPELPDAELELAEAGYPEKAPAERDPQALPVPSPVQPAQSTQPAQPAQPARPTQPPQPVPSLPPALAVTPPAKPVPQRQTPPPPPPPTARPSQSVPPPRPSREEPALPPSGIPEIPFQGASAVPQEAAEPDLNYSRTVKAVAGQYIEIPFRGPGWVYLGEFGSRRGVSYDSRRIEDEGMTFVFRADEEGTYSLKFNRQDFVRDYILNDYVKVIVEPPPISAGSAWSNPRTAPERVYALPRWPLALDSEGRAADTQAPAAPLSGPERGQQPNAQPGAAQAGSATVTPDAVQPQPGTGGQSGANQSAGTGERPGEVMPAGAAASGTPPEDAGTASAGMPDASGAGAVQPAAAVPVTAEDWLKKARDEYEAGRIAGALGTLDQFMIRFPGGSDEALWLYGQSYEANNEATRNIRQALECYRRLTGEYPQSNRYDDAQRRIVYLERFYFNIR